MVTLLAAVVDYALLLGSLANNCVIYSYIVSHGGGLCLVVGGRWLTKASNMAILLAAVVEYFLLPGVVANNCVRYGYIVSRGGGICLVVGVQWLTIVLDMVTLLAAASYLIYSLIRKQK